MCGHASLVAIQYGFGHRLVPGNAGYMLALGAIMALEKNAPWGKRLSRPLGFALLSWAVIVTAANTA